MDKLKKILPQNVSNAISALGNERFNELNEIRLRVNKPIYLYLAEDEYAVCNGGICKKDGDIFTKDDCALMWRKMCDGSPYSFLNEQRAGYLTVNGNRIGFCGEYASVENNIKHLQNVSSFCVRIKHEVKGCANKIYKYIFNNNVPCDTLIVSPPGCGKTTLIRDIARIISFDGFNTCIADEREEIAAVSNGVPTLDVGKRTDVFTGVSKKIAIANMLRSLRPDVIIADEIGDDEELKEVRNAKHKGVKVFATAHGNMNSEIKDIYGGIFERYIFLSNRFGIGTVEGVFDKEFKAMKICC